MIPLRVFFCDALVKSPKRSQISIPIKQGGARPNRLINSKGKPSIPSDPILFFHPGQDVFHEFQDGFFRVGVLLNRFCPPICDSKFRDQQKQSESVSLDSDGCGDWSQTVAPSQAQQDPTSPTLQGRSATLQKDGIGHEEKSEQTDIGTSDSGLILDIETDIGTTETVMIRHLQDVHTYIVMNLYCAAYFVLRPVSDCLGCI